MTKRGLRSLLNSYPIRSLQRIKAGPGRPYRPKRYGPLC